MRPIKNILCPTDFSRPAQVALPVALALARDHGAKLTLLHVRPRPAAMMMGEFGSLPPEPGETDEALKGKMRQLLPVEFLGAFQCCVADGDAAEEILKAAQQGPCDMIVLGTHGRSGLGRLLLGSVAEAVLRSAPCPVLTVKPPVAALAADRAETGEAEPAFDPDDLTTVCSVANPAEAEVIRNALVAEGIRCFIEGAQQAAIVGILGIPIKIQVPVGDANRASKFIQRHAEHRL